MNLRCIRYDMLYSYVLNRVHYWAKQTEIDEDGLVQAFAKNLRRLRPRNKPSNLQGYMPDGAAQPAVAKLQAVRGCSATDVKVC